MKSLARGWSLSLLHIAIVTQVILLCFVPNFIGSAFRLPGMSDQPASLYGPEDKVVLLNASSIKETIYNSDRAWFVEFFSSWCGHCINFAPKYKQFASDLYDWRHVVAIAAIDCADELNTGTCREYEIMGYPSLVFFPPQAPQMIEALGREKEEGIMEKLNTGINVEKEQSMEKQKKSLMDKLEPYFPRLIGVNENDDPNEESLWDINDGFHMEKPKCVAVLYETASSTVGREVVLKLSLSREIKVYRFTAKNRLYKKLGLDAWPAVGVLKENDQSEIVDLNNNQNIVQFLFKELHDRCGVKLPEKDDLIMVSSERPKLRSSLSQALPERDVVSMDDMLHALRDTFHKEVALIKTLNGEKLTVLKTYLYVLNELFPFDRSNVKMFFGKLNEWVTEHEEIQSIEFLEKLEELEKEYNPWDGVDLSRWDECAGTKPGLRGYTCGLWRIFHSLTVIGYEKGTHLNVMESIHGYTRQFFGCRDCSDHFNDMVVRDKIHNFSIKEQALWLWKAHNEANLRLRGEPSDDPGFPKQEYPSKGLCHECHLPFKGFDKEQVLNYLLHIYTHPRRSTNKAVSHSRQLYNFEGGRHKKHQQGWFSMFSMTDIGLFLFIYVLVACLLLLGFLHFKNRGRGKLNLNFAMRQLCSNRNRSIV